MRNVRSRLFLASVVIRATLAILAGVGFAVPGPCRAATPNGGWDAAWSPDGARIAFTSGSPHSIPNLWVIGADKSGLRQLTTLGAHEPQWLPDGKTIVFGTLRNGTSVYMAIDPNGEMGSEKPVEAMPPGGEAPVWSPDGSLVAYGVMTKDGSARDLGFARTSGGKPTGLTSKFWCRDWTWSPDGATIAFVVGRSTGTSIWAADLATQDVRLLYKGFCGAPAFSPDGKRLAFAVPDVRSGHRIVIMDLATRAETPISVASFNGKKIQWSPDSRRLYIESTRKSEAAIWSVGVDGSNLIRLTPKGMPSVGPSLSPDGAKFVCQVTRSTAFGPELSLFNTSGRLLGELTTTSVPSFWSPVWSPNGKELAFQSDVDREVRLYTGTLAGRMNASCAPILPGATEVAWLPDGKSLLLANAGRLSIVQKAGGKNAIKPVPKITSVVQGPRLNGEEVIVTEWGTRDATLTAIRLDGSKRRLLTQKSADGAKDPATSKPRMHGMPHKTPQQAPQTPHKPTTAPPSNARLEPTPKSRTRPAVRQASFKARSSSIFSLASNQAAPAPRGMVPAPPQAMGPAAPHGMGPAAPKAAGPAIPPAEPEPEVGNPHASLGLMGPQKNVAQNEPPAVVDLSPAVSPDRKSVAFLRGGQVWLVGIDGAAERQVTNLENGEDGMRTVSSPSWSPDGKSLVFLAFNTASGSLVLELWTSGQATGSERMAYSEHVTSEYGVFYADCTNAPVFMPDGKRILFTSIATGEPRIVSVAVDGTDLQEIVPAPAVLPALDAMGGRLAYVDLSDMRERIRVMDMATGKTSGPLFRK